MSRRWCMDGGCILAGTSGAALRAALSSPLRAVGISLLKNTARIAGRRWTEVLTMGLREKLIHYTNDLGDVDLKQEAIATIEHIAQYMDEDELLHHSRPLALAYLALTEDASVPVVRCKDCVHWDDDPDTYGADYGPKGKCMKSFETMCADDFCSHGDRREESGP